MSGVLIPHAEIACDHRDCPGRFFARGNVTIVRRLAAADGWIFAVRLSARRRGPSIPFDFCAEHAGDPAIVGASLVLAI